MLLGAAMHSQGIAFYRGGALATALMSTSTMGHHREPSSSEPPRRLPPRQVPSIEKGSVWDVYFNWDGPAKRKGPLRAQVHKFVDTSFVGIIFSQQKCLPLSPQ